MERLDLIKKRPDSAYSHGYIGRVFEYHERCGKNEDGTIPVIIKPDPVETKKKKFIN